MELTTFYEVLIGLLGLLVVLNYMEITANRHQLKLFERKLNLLLEQQGVSVKGDEFIPFEVQQALKNNQKIKAIRLYRQHTGVSLLAAQKAVNDFIDCK